MDFIAVIILFAELKSASNRIDHGVGLRHRHPAPLRRKKIAAQYGDTVSNVILLPVDGLILPLHAVALPPVAISALARHYKTGNLPKESEGCIAGLERTCNHGIQEARGAGAVARIHVRIARAGKRREQRPAPVGIDDALRQDIEVPVDLAVKVEKTSRNIGAPGIVQHILAALLSFGVDGGYPGSHTLVAFYNVAERVP